MESVWLEGPRLSRPIEQQLDLEEQPGALQIQGPGASRFQKDFSPSLLHSPVQGQCWCLHVPQSGNLSQQTLRVPCAHTMIVPTPPQASEAVVGKLRHITVRDSRKAHKPNPQAGVFQPVIQRIRL